MAEDEQERDRAIREEMAKALEDAGFPAYAHAVRKLGYLVTTMNIDTFTDEEVEAWNQAVDEWEGP